MKKIVLNLFLTFLVFLSSYAQKELLPFDKESGVYLIHDDSAVKIKSVSFESAFRENSQGNFDITEYYYNVIIDNADSMTIRVYLTKEAVCFQINNPDKTIRVLCLEYSEFEGPSGSIYYYHSLTDESFIRILYERNIKFFIIVNLPIRYKNKTHILHLKPETF